MHRKALSCILATALTAAAGATAVAQDGGEIKKPNFEAQYSSKRPNTATGIRLDTSSNTDPETARRNPLRQFIVSLPAGSKSNYRAADVCTATDEQIQADPAGACPSGSKIGTGEGEVSVAGVANPLILDVQAFNAKAGPIFALTAPAAQNRTSVIRSRLKGTKLTAKLEPNCVDPAATSCPGQEILLTRFEIDIESISKRSGRRRIAWLTTPPQCPRGGEFKFKGTFVYDDGTKQSVNSTSDCVRRRR